MNITGKYPERRCSARLPAFEEGGGGGQAAGLRGATKIELDKLHDAFMGARCSPRRWTALPRWCGRPSTWATSRRWCCASHPTGCPTRAARSPTTTRTGTRSSMASPACLRLLQARAGAAWLPDPRGDPELAGRHAGRGRLLPAMEEPEEICVMHSRTGLLGLLRICRRCDAASLLFWDTLRERGNEYLRHEAAASRRC